MFRQRILKHHGTDHNHHFIRICIRIKQIYRKYLFQNFRITFDYNIPVAPMYIRIY